VVSNQRGVAKGLLTEDEPKLIRRRIYNKLVSTGAQSRKYITAHMRKSPCSSRKPAPRMLLAAAQSHDLDLASSWMMGSSGIDVEAGKNASFKTVRILPKDVVEDSAAGLAAQLLFTAVHHLLALRP